MVNKEINPLILKKIEQSNVPQHVKDFIREVLRHERTIFEEYSAGGMPRYSRIYENLLNKYVKDQQDLSIE